METSLNILLKFVVFIFAVMSTIVVGGDLTNCPKNKIVCVPGYCALPPEMCCQCDRSPPIHRHIKYLPTEKSMIVGINIQTKL